MSNVMGASWRVPSAAWPTLDSRMIAIWRRTAWFRRDVLLPFIVTRVALMLVGLFALTPLQGVDLDGPRLASVDWLNVWSAWDSEWYLSIARDGYSYVPGVQSSAAFAPALPLIMRLGGAAVGEADANAYLLTGLLATNLALITALGYLVALLRLDFDASIVRRTVVYLLVFPSTLFLSAVYPHSLFLALTIAAFYYARQGRWWLVGVLGGLAGLTRLHAVLIVIPLGYEYFASRAFDLRRVRSDVLALGLIPVGGLAFALYLFAISGEPLAVLKAGAAWGRQLSLPWDAILPFVTQGTGAHGHERSVFDLGFTLLLVAITSFAWRRLPASLSVYAGVFLLLIVSSGTLKSSMRYGLELFPIFVGLAIWGHRRLFHLAYLGTAGYMALMFIRIFATHRWVA